MKNIEENISSIKNGFKKARDTLLYGSFTSFLIGAISSEIFFPEKTHIEEYPCKMELNSLPPTYIAGLVGAGILAILYELSFTLERRALNNY